MDKKSVDKLMSLVHKFDNVRTFAISRTVLFFLDDLFNYAAGLSSMRYLPFLLTSLLVISFSSLYLIHIGIALAG